MNLETFFEKFDLFAYLPDAVAKMRELVLQLAVHGKLVDQNHSEVSAIECIRKANKPIVEIALYESTDIPVGWIALPLGCIIASNIGGGTPSKANLDYWNGPIPWASVKDIQREKYLVSTVDSITEQGLKNSSSNLIPSGRLIVVTRMGLGKLAVNKVPIAINQDLRAIEPTTALDIDFAYLLFKSLKMDGKGVTVKGITVDKLHAMPVLLPPLAEQRRIVAKVDELMALCDWLEAQRQEQESRHAALARASLARFAEAPTPANLNFLFHKSYDITPADLRKTILTLAVQGKLVPQDPNDEPAEAILSATQLYFEQLVKAKQISPPKPLPPIAEDEKPFSLPSRWAWCRLGQIMRISSGDGLIAKDMNEGTIPVYGGNGVAGYHDTNNVSKPTLVIGRVGFYCGSVHITPEKAWVTDNAFITTFDKKQIEMAFLYWLLMATNLRERDNATAQPVISGAKVYPIVLAIPPLAEQRRIVAKVDQLMALVDELEAQLDASRATGEKLLSALVEELTVGKESHAAA